MNCSQMHQKFAPLTAQAERRILQYDRAAGFGPGGTQPNRNRFYTYLTRNGSDVEIRTVAVKATNKAALPMVKEVVRASVDDPWIHVHDLGFLPIAGYIVDWAPEGFSKVKHWAYGRRWEAAPYAPRCMWKIDAPVINPELLKKTRRFRWAAWEPACCDNILDYLKVYREHPEIELLSKSGLGRYCTKVTIVRKLKTDKAFRQFFMQNAETIKRDRIGADVIMKAYTNGLTLFDAWREIEARRKFKGYRLPAGISALKALAYADTKRIRINEYTNYLHNCQTLGLNLTDTKVTYPKAFSQRDRNLQDQVDAIRRKENAKQIETMNSKLAAIAEKWSWLELKGRDYCITIPRTEQEFTEVGRAMINCLSQYSAKVARGEYIVVFVQNTRRPEAPFVAAAYDPKRQAIAQCYGIKNSKPPKQVLDFVKAAFDGATAGKLKKAA